MRRAFLAVCAIAWGSACACLADTIVINGLRYEGVYVRESALRYYVQLPQSGTSISVPKSSVAPEDVIIDEDREARKALLQAWKDARKTRRPPAENGKHPKPGHVTRAAPPPVAQQEAASPVRVFPVFPGAPLAGGSTAAAPRAMFPGEARKESSERIEEKEKSVDEKGTPNLVLKGNQKKDPERDRNIAQWNQAKRLWRAQRQEQLERERQLWATDQWEWQQQDAEDALPYGNMQPQPLSGGAPWGASDRWRYYNQAAPGYWYQGWRPAEEDRRQGAPSPGEEYRSAPEERGYPGAGEAPGDGFSHGAYYGPGWSHGESYGVP